ncbi:hypothetical protein [uncultured Psychrobacillus sp.]|uniref:hypothetical protein n=1 Tax=uncultured Psychrobacillus sp. TaxID=1551585 RepID=UPI002621D3BB|nr:hypothetical protein [uncultured Psychrobacillus sp.]
MKNFKWKELIFTLILMMIVGLIIGYSLATTKSLDQSDYIEIHKFGAIGDGKTDDTLAFRKASKERGIISLESGKTYLISKTIFLDLSTIKGIQGNNAKILVRGDIPAFHLTGNKLEDGAEPPSNVGLEDEFSAVIEGLHVYSNNHQGTALVLDGSFGVNISNSHFYSLKKGIELINKNRNVIFTENQIWDMADYAIHYNNTNTHQSIITNNHISYAKIAILFENGDVHNTQLNSNDIEVGHSENDNTLNAVKVIASEVNSQFSQAQIVGNTIEDHFHAKEGLLNFYAETFDPSKIGTDDVPYIGMVELVGNEFSGSSKAVVLENSNDLIVNGNTFKIITEVFISIFTGGEGINITGNTFSGKINKDSGGRVLEVKGGKTGFNSSFRYFMFNNNSAYNLSENLINIKRKDGVKEEFNVSNLSMSNNIFNTTKATDYVIDINVPSLTNTIFSSNIITTGSNNALKITGENESSLVIRDNIVNGLE